MTRLHLLRIIFFFAFAVGIAHANAHQETVELRFRKRVSAVMLDWILRCKHEERPRQGMRVIVDGDLRLVHRFEKRGLSLGRGAIDFVGDDNICEDGPGLEFEALRGRVISLTPITSLGQHVRSELNALERAAE